MQITTISGQCQFCKRSNSAINSTDSNLIILGIRSESLSMKYDIVICQYCLGTMFDMTKDYIRK